MQGRLHLDSLKSTGNGPIHSPASGPINTKHKNKTNKQTNIQNHNKTKTKKHGEVGPLPALRKEMHDNIVCHLFSVQRRHGFRQVTNVQPQQTSCRQLKELVVDQYKVQWAIPSKTTQTRKEPKKTKTNNQNKNQPKETEKGLRPAVGIPCTMTSYVSS